MKNQITILLSILLFIPLMLLADDMSVESFRRLDTDMDARINYPEKDPSGRSCAIIKVVNQNTGFVFDTGTVAVVKIKQVAGEIWVYVQPGVKKFIVSHPTLGVMRDYYFPIAIEEATVYELRLSSGNVHTYVEQKSSSAYLVLNSVPEGADVYIDDEWVGTTPFSKKYSKEQTLQYRVSMPLYYDEVGEIKLENSKNEVSTLLKVAHGSIRVYSDPTGASVFLDNENKPRGSAPLIINEVASGPHRVRVQLPRYGQKVMDVTVNDGVTANVNAKLTASFSSVTVNSLPGATIKADGAIKGTGSATWEQDAGLCDIEVSLNGHRNQSQQIQILPGEPQIITLEPVPQYGILAVESTPPGADIYIDGKWYGTTPEVLEQMLAMDHTVRLSKTGCADFTRNINIIENQETTITGKLFTGQDITITTGMSGDEIYLDGKYAGKSPLTTTLTYGTHKVYGVRGDKHTVEKNFEVYDGQHSSVNLIFDGPVEFTIKGVKFNMITVEGGTFSMGATSKLAKDADNDQRPIHNVTLGDYMIGQTEVTQALWEAVMGNNPSNYKGDDLPVEYVSWDDCQKFIKKLNKLSGLNFRLPTEAEWEYAAKGGKKALNYLYSGSNNLEYVAWYVKNSLSMIHQVRTKAPNELGLYDMTGNVWEWCSDWYNSYPSSAQSNPSGPSSGSERVCRGGGYNSNPHYLGTSYRRHFRPSLSRNGIGLRLALIP